MTRRMLTLLACGLALLLSASAAVAQSPQVQKDLTSATCPGSGCVSLGVAGLGSVGFQVTGTWVGTITFEGSIDGITYATLSVVPSNSATTTTTTTGNGIWSAGVGGLFAARARMSAYTSGTATVTIQGAEPGSGVGAFGGGGSGAPSNADYIVGTANPALSNEIVALPLCATFLTAGTSFSLAECLTNEMGTAGPFGRQTGSTWINTTLNGTLAGDITTWSLNSLTGTAGDRFFSNFWAGAGQTGLFRPLTISALVTNANIDTATAINGDVTVTDDTLNTVATVFNSTLTATGTSVIPVYHGYYANLVLTGADVDITGHAKGFYQAAMTIGAGSTIETYSAFYAQPVNLTGITNSYFLWYGNELTSGSNCNNEGVWRVNGLGILAYYNPCFEPYEPGAADFERIILRWGDTGVFGSDNRAYIGVEEGGTGADRPLHLIGGNLSFTSTLTPAVTDTSANSCGTGTQTIAGNDNAGKVTVIGSAGTSCTVTFATAFVNAPSCTVTNETSAALVRATSTTTTVVLAGVFAENDVLAYVCLGR